MWQPAWLTAAVATDNAVLGELSTVEVTLQPNLVVEANSTVSIANFTGMAPPCPRVQLAGPDAGVFFLPAAEWNEQDRAVVLTVSTQIPSQRTVTIYFTLRNPASATAGEFDPHVLTTPPGPSAEVGGAVGVTSPVRHRLSLYTPSTI